MKFRLDIQGFRAIAVLLVFIYHLNEKWLPGGYIGVDMFLVISGFLITSILINDLDNNKFSFVKFYKNRIFRIVPVYYLMLLLVGIGGLFIYISTNAGSLKLGIFNSVLFNSNSYLSKLDSYFGESSYENPILHTWSLAVEMKFYLILPIIIYLIYKLDKKYYFISILVLLLISLFYSQYQIQFNNNIQESYFSLFSRSWEFLLGSLVAIKPIVLKEKFKNIFSIIGIIFIISSAILYNSLSLFPGFLALIPCFGTILLISSEGSYINKILSNKIIVKIGELSYSIYLWHWPIMAFFRYYNNQYELNIKEIIVIIVFTIGLAYLSYNFIEKKTKQIKDVTMITSLFGTIIILSLIVFFYNKIHNRFSNIPIEYSSYLSNGLDSHGKYYLKEEYIGSNTANDTVLLLGDSHGLAMKPYFDYIGKNNKISIQTITNDIYIPIKGINAIDIDEEWRRSDYIKLSNIAEGAMKKYDKIFLVRSWDNPERVKEFNLMLKLLLPKINKNQRLIILSDFPSVDKSPIRVNRGIVKKSDYQFLINYPKIPQNFISEINNDKKYEFWDLNKSNVFINAPYFNDTVMYYDASHLNKFGAIKYAKLTEKIFMEYYNK